MARMAQILLERCPESFQKWKESTDRYGLLEGLPEVPEVLKQKRNGENLRAIISTDGCCYALVDKADFLRFGKMRFWSTPYGYLRTKVNGKQVPLHRLVNGTPDGLLTDHINRDIRDCRKENLRSVNASENAKNRYDVNKGRFE